MKNEGVLSNHNPFTDTGKPPKPVTIEEGMAGILIDYQTEVGSLKYQLKQKEKRITQLVIKVLEMENKIDDLKWEIKAMEGGL